MKQDPHAPYADAVMDALGDLHDSEQSWTEYNSDNGEVMLMDIVITLDLEKARDAGWFRGLLICWDQTTGWQWAYMTGERGRNADPAPLVRGPLVADPADIATAVKALLTEGGYEQLPLEAKERPRTGEVALTPELRDALGTGEDADLTEEEAFALAAYAQ